MVSWINLERASQPNNRLPTLSFAQVDPRYVATYRQIIGILLQAFGQLPETCIILGKSLQVSLNLLSRLSLAQLPKTEEQRVVGLIVIRSLGGCSAQPTLGGGGL